MAYSLVSSIISSAPDSGWTINGGTSPSIDTTGANVIVIGVSWYSGYVPPLVLSDSKGNTWLSLTKQSSGGTGVSTQMFYAYNPTVGTGHTFTVGTNTIYAELMISAWSAGTFTTDPFDVENGATTNGGSPLQPGSVSPNQNDELLIATLAGIGSINTIDSGFTILLNRTAAPGGGATRMSGALAYKIQTSAGAENPQWAWSDAGFGTAPGAAAIATFKVSTGGGGGGGSSFPAAIVAA